MVIAQAGCLSIRAGDLQGGKAAEGYVVEAASDLPGVGIKQGFPWGEWLSRGQKPLSSGDMLECAVV